MAIKPLKVRSSERKPKQLEKAWRKIKDRFERSRDKTLEVG